MASGAPIGFGLHLLRPLGGPQTPFMLAPLPNFKTFPANILCPRSYKHYGMPLWNAIAAFFGHFMRRWSLFLLCWGYFTNTPSSYNKAPSTYDKTPSLHEINSV